MARASRSTAAASAAVSIPSGVPRLLKEHVMSVQIRLTEEALGPLPGDPAIYEKYIASKAPDAATTQDEVAVLGTEEVVREGTCIFPKEDGRPFFYDYQLKGGIKGVTVWTRDIPGCFAYKHKKLNSVYKRTIHGMIFVRPRKVFFQLPEGGQMGYCDRPLRAETMYGERICLARSETVPIGSLLDFEITSWDVDFLKHAEDWLNFGGRYGLGQWRGGGKGTFEWRRTHDTFERDVNNQFTV